MLQFNGPVLELMTESRTRFDQRLAGLGPDILAPEFDHERFLRRLREDDPTRPIGDALLRQQNLAGIGNLWKVEGCFAAEHRPVAADRQGQRRGGAAHRRAQSRPRMQQLGAGRQPERAGAGSTAARGSPARAAAPASRIRARGQWDDNRPTFWCPECQR